jgi:hypothetical protein
MTYSSSPTRRSRRSIVTCYCLLGVGLAGCSSATCPAGRKGDTGACFSESPSLRNAATADEDAGSNHGLDAG